jgi:hypothetical protein
VVAGLLAAILSALLLRQAARARDVRPVRFFVPPPEKTTFRFLFGGGPPALSPDGRKLVFAGESSDGKRLLWLRSLESVTPQPLAGTEDGVYPFWSPDGRFIGFFAETKLKKIEVSGGPPVTLCDVSEGGRGGSWNRDNTILFAGRYTPVYRVSAAGGQRSPSRSSIRCEETRRIAGRSSCRTAGVFSISLPRSAPRASATPLFSPHSMQRRSRPL